jgi:hypothetical protein
MSSAPSPTRWLTLCALAASTLVLVVIALTHASRARPLDAPGGLTGAAPAQSCMEDPLLLALPEEPGDVLALFAAPRNVALSLDGRLLTGSAEAIRLASGAHELVAESPGTAPLKTRFQLSPGRPALFHVIRDRDLGLVLLRQGDRCLSCAPGRGSLQIEPVASAQRVPLSLARAAQALRTDDWMTAESELRRVPLRARAQPSALRLLAAAHAAAGLDSEARAHLTRLPAGDSTRLLLRRLEKLTVDEARREPERIFARWNAVTDRYQALLTRFEPELTGLSAPRLGRLQRLSEGFTAAARTRDVAELHETVGAAEKALAELSGHIRAARAPRCGTGTSAVTASTLTK